MCNENAETTVNKDSIGPFFGDTLRMHVASHIGVLRQPRPLSRDL